MVGQDLTMYPHNVIIIHLDTIRMYTMYILILI